MIKTDFFTVGILSGTSPAQNLGAVMRSLLRMAAVSVVTKVSLRQLSIERQFFIDNLLVRIHLIIEMILLDRPCAMGV